MITNVFFWRSCFFSTGKSETLQHFLKVGVELEFPVERSKSGKMFKFRKTGHPKISVVVGISGRTFKIRKIVQIQQNGSSENFGGTWNFRSNVQNPEKRSNSEKQVIRKFRWYLEFPLELSKSGKNVQIQKNGSSENFGGTPNFRSNVQNPEKRSNSENGSSEKFGAQ